MNASSTSSSEPRSRRQRRALGAFVVACLAALAASWPLRSHLVEMEFTDSRFGRRETAAFECAAGRPLVALLGSSQTRRALDARAIEQTMFAGTSPRPCVFNMGTDALHPSVYPYALRRLFARGAVGGVVMELGHIAQDQYGGAWLVRDFFEDEPVRDAFRGCARGRRLMATADRERRMPWSVVPGILRTLWDRNAPRAGDPEDSAALLRAQGFEPVTNRKDPATVLRDLDAIYAAETDDLVDASPQHTFVAVAQIAASLCRAHDVPLVVVVMPVNRSLAPRVAILRHFEETARNETIPALRAMGVPVLVPPDTFFDASNFSDHVHLHAEAASAFTAWFAAGLRDLHVFR